VKRYGFFGDGNLLIQAPTSSCKTFIGEMAAIQAALRRKKVVYLVPLKALAEEKYLDFREKYGRYGLDVIISTRDHREFDGDLENGRFSIAVVVYEKLSQLLVRRPERLAEIALVVADELELLSDPERGATAEVLLARILEAQIRLIGLSAVIGQGERVSGGVYAGDLADWMGARLVFYERRPVELRYGVLHEGVFRYRTYNERCEDAEVLVSPSDSESSWEILAENVCAFAGAGETCVVFVKAKYESRRGAELLGQRVGLSPATETIELLRDLEATRSRDCLIETLGAGVAFHNADLSPEERRAVEHGFRTGEVRVLVSTSTLAMGMNLPAQNVFIASEKWRYDPPHSGASGRGGFGMPWKTQILRAEYENMGGRAGRYGTDRSFGRSILIATSPFDYETLWRRYVEGECEPIEPQLSPDNLGEHVLGLVASRSCRTEEAVQRFLENTLSGKWIWQERLTLDESAFQIRAVLNRATDAGVIMRDPDGRLDATALGVAVASKGIAITSASDLEHWIRESQTRIWSPIDLLLAASMTLDGCMVQLSLTTREYEHADYAGMLKQICRNEDIFADVPLNRIRNGTTTPFFEEVRAIKIALLLNAWIDHVPVCELEEKFGVMAGQIRAAADQVSWLIDATAAIATALGTQTEFINNLKELAERVQRGLRPEALPLATSAGAQLNRAALIGLVSRGLHTPETLAAIPLEVLESRVPLVAARRLREWALRHTAPGDAVSGDQSMARKDPALIVDDKRPGEILLDGARIRLQEKQYRLIRVLASVPGECVPYDTIYTSVWGDMIVESNQMHFQKRKLLDSIRAEAPDRAKLITTVPKRGFVLNLTDEEVVLRAAPVPSAA